MGLAALVFLLAPQRSSAQSQASMNQDVCAVLKKSDAQLNQPEEPGYRGADA